MNESPRRRVDDIFLEAIEKPEPEREAFLDQICGDDAGLRRQVEELVAADIAAGGAEFLESAFMAKAGSDSPLPEAEALGERAPTTDTSRFQILAHHQQGGLGEVLIAHDRQLNREVAIKQIKPRWQHHDEARQRFVQEAEVTGRLEHPGVVPVYAMGVWPDGRHYYAMRFIQGTTLAEVIDQYHDPARRADTHWRNLELRQILNRFVDVCNTIHYAHSHRILHRDIKPSNIMVGPYGETLVVDWGLAKLLDTPFDESMTAQLLEGQVSSAGSTPTQVGGRVGTPQYMSPEQATGQLDEVSVRTDIYLLGATLYHVLTGRPPHQDDSISKLIGRISSGQFAKPTSIDSEISARLEAICLKAMATDQAARYAGCHELAADIECWMADEPVSVYRDPVTVRWARWVRRHRTAAYSGAVATVLVLLGAIVGSMLWNYQRTRQFEIERQNNLKEVQLLANRQQRLSELGSSVRAASTLAERELTADRFSSALSILLGALDSIADEPQISEQYEHLRQRADRIGRIVDFYRYADATHQQNLLSRETKAIMSCTAGLRSLGILDKDDWWAHLPDQDLNPQQQDDLRWDVYQQWLSFDAMLVKTIGTRLAGSSRPGTAASLVPAMRRFLGTEIGKREASAALVVSDRADLFRPSEAVRWYRSQALFRLGKGKRLLGRELATTQNASDAQSLGVLSLISGLDSSFQLFFREYKGDDPLLAARNLFSRSSQLRPDFYWVQLSLAQSEYLLALRDPEPAWQQLDSAIQAASRCIAMNPEKCFAYADRSSMYRTAARMVKQDRELDPRDRDQRATELLQWSLTDAETADRLGGDQPWIGWQHGLAMHESGAVDPAVDRFLHASKLTFPFIELEDATLVRVDDLRGRSEAVELVADLANSDPDQTRYATLLASIQLNQNRLGEASESVEQAFAGDDPPAHAYAVRGMVRLRRDQIDAAIRDFRQAARLDPRHEWANFGVATCLERQGQFGPALEAYRRAESMAQTDEHRAGCLLGQCRLHARQQLFEPARQAIQAARRLEPACDVMTVARPLAREYLQLRDHQADPAAAAALKRFLKQLAELPRATNIELTPNAPTSRPFQLALLNGGFELLGPKYWDHPPVRASIKRRGDRSTADLSEEIAHGGRRSLHIRGGPGDGEHQRASIGQSLPVPDAGRYQLSCWVRTQGLRDGAVRLTTTPGGTVLEIPGGTRDWNRMEGQILIPAADSEGVGVRMMRLEIVSSGPGEAWIDDVEIVSAAR